MFPRTLTIAGRRASVLTATIHMPVQTTGGNAAACAVPAFSRSFVSVRLNDPSLRRRTDSYNNFMQSQRESLASVEKLLRLPFETLNNTPDRKAWLAVIRHINSRSQAPTSQLHKLGGDAALALMLKLLEVGERCGANLLSHEFAALSYNLHGLGTLTFDESDKAVSAAYADCVVEAFTAHLGPTGRAFAALSADERPTQVNRFMAHLARDAHRLGMGLREEDMLELTDRQITFVDELTIGGGAFAVTPDGTPLLALSAALTREAAELGLLIDGRGNTADAELLRVIVAIAHELVHACQLSSFSSPDADSRQFARRLTNMLSVGSAHVMEAAKQANPNLTTPKLFPPEFLAYHVTLQVLRAFSESPKVEPGMRETAGRLLQGRILQRIADQMNGVEPLDHVTGETTPGPSTGASRDPD
jgi:hypothetical protein